MSATRRCVTLDANEAVASVAYRTNEVIAIYPITPASPMGEHADQWAAQGRVNLWGSVPDVIEMQSEGGAAGAVHGALQAGALTTTFTASQGLLLMLPNLYKIAGELTPFCLHVAARTVATHALSIHGDHSDVMACRQAGIALLASGSVQEAQDFAAIGQAATLRTRVPVLHFFDGFRTSHEVQRVEPLEDEVLRSIMDERLVSAHRQRALTPDRPVIRGTAQDPDAFFQAREAASPAYRLTPGVVLELMDRFAEATGRRHGLFDYEGHAEAERVLVVMGSGGETAGTTVRRMAAAGERVGVVRVRLYRPFSSEHFLAALPESTRAIAVLDRTKEPGSVGEPLYLDVVAALAEARGEHPAADARVIGGRYGLSSKEFTPAMVQAVLGELSADRPRHSFTVGIHDDVSGSSLPVDGALDFEPEGTTCAVFFGLGSDGTVTANKSSLHVIARATGAHVQGHFVYDSKKAGAMTVSHLRFGEAPIRAPWKVREASFVACHHYPFLERVDVLGPAARGATFLLNTSLPPDRVWDELPLEVQQEILDKELSVHVIDASRVAREAGLGRRVSTVMQACFFELTAVLPRDVAIAEIRKEIERLHGRRGPEIVRRNEAAVDAALGELRRVPVPERATARRGRPPVVPDDAPDFVKAVTAVLMAGKGDGLPVSAFPVDGTWPLGTSRFEKRGLAHEIPAWDEDLCIQCNKCSLVCPHAAIRVKTPVLGELGGAPEGFRAVPLRGGSGGEDAGYIVQVAPDDCTGCGLCIEICPARDKSNPRRVALAAVEREAVLERERACWDYFLELPEADRRNVKLDNKGSQLLEPLFEASGACAGCGETPYLKLLSQLFGDRALVANATGCSSIFGGNLPTTPWSTDAAGRGPAWANSLFEDNSEFGFGFRLAVDQLAGQARALVRELGGHLGDELVDGLLTGEASTEAGLAEQRERVVALRRRLEGVDSPAARRLAELADWLVRKSVWLVGGDGWAYDIGYGGLDHVLSQRRDVNVLVLDTEVYSNTGGQQSKATPLGATAKFAFAGKETPKKDLALEAMTYGHVYVARVALGARDQQAVKAFVEADSWRGPSLILAYSHCIAHGYDLRHGATQQSRAVASGAWPLYRFDPRRVAQGKPPLVLDSGEPKLPLSEYAAGEERFRAVMRRDPVRFKELMAKAQRSATQRFSVYRQLAGLEIPDGVEE